MDYTRELVKFIRRNRVSTTEVADALGKSGVLSGLETLTPDQFRVGPARAVFTAHESNYALHEQLRDVKEGEVVIVFAHACKDRAVMGDLMARFVLLYQGAEALVVNGLVRDGSRLRRERYPIWCQGATPLGCFNVPADPFPVDLEKKIRQEIDGGIAVCDDGGVAVIPPSRLNQEMLDRLNQIELLEDVWYYCLNTLKWDTKKIVCDKAYLSAVDQLPAAYRNQLEKLKTQLDKKS